jgi:hypothetical protein
MPTNHASIAAAQTAGYKLVQQDRGAAYANASNRFETLLEKWLSGQVGSAGSMFRAHGEGSSQANADAAALASLNEQRNIKYGRAAAGGNQDSTNQPMTADVT